MCVAIHWNMGKLSMPGPPPTFPEKKKSENTVDHLHQPSTAIRYLILYVGLLGQQVDSVDYKAGHQPLRPQLYDWDPHEWKD